MIETKTKEVVLPKKPKDSVLHLKVMSTTFLLIHFFKSKRVHLSN